MVILCRLENNFDTLTASYCKATSLKYTVYICFVYLVCCIFQNARKRKRKLRAWAFYMAFHFLTFT